MSEQKSKSEDDATLFTALIRKHGGIVRRIASTYCSNSADRADLAQDIYAHLWRSWPRYDRVRPFPTWMYRVALNVAISHLRESYRRNAVMSPWQDEHLDIAGTDDTENTQLVQALPKLIAGLDPMNRALLVLYVDDRSHRDIADILGISESNVGTKISRLKQRLRTQLSP
jgi:RNA polymerase sigma-70 factor (ECF subfamily)